MNRIKPEKPNLEPTECPHCHERIDCSTGIKKDISPSEGDISICVYCGEPSKFDAQLNMVKLERSELKEIMSDPVVSTSMLHIKARRIAQDPARHEAYVKQLDVMSDAVKEWRKKNQNLSPIIQYNFTAQACVIAALEDAINSKFVSINDDARTMFKDLGWMDDKPTMPTILMVRAVLEHTFGNNE
jgi:hypothetical protein